MTRKKPRPDCCMCHGKGIVILETGNFGTKFRGCNCPPNPPPMETALETQQRMVKEARDE